MRISDWSSDVCSSDLFTFANANIARGDVRVGTDVPIKLGHEALANTHDFIIRFIPRVEIGATFARPQWQIGRASCRVRVCQEVSISVVAGYLKTERKY